LVHWRHRWAGHRVIVTYGGIAAFVVTPGMMAIAHSAGLY
jgi:hypothetical protein